MPRQTSLTPEQTRLRASIAAHESWARTTDRAARTRAARDARRARYIERARELQGPDATPEAIEQAADDLYRADMQRMALKASRARQAKAAAEARETVTDDA